MSILEWANSHKVNIIGGIKSNKWNGTRNKWKRRCLLYLLCLRALWLLRLKPTVIKHSIGISIVENLGTLFESSDVSKRRQARVNLILWKFLGHVASHQVIGSWFWFHQSDQWSHTKCAICSDFSFSAPDQRYPTWLISVYFRLKVGSKHFRQL